MPSTALASAATSAPIVKKAGRPTALDGWFSRLLGRSQFAPISENMLITPEIAEYLLGRNEDNRSIRNTKLEQLKADMKQARFKFNGESIIISKDGKLNDGQHRLTAIVQTRLPQRMIVVFGVERDTRFTIDVGAARSASDHMSLAGWPYSAQVAAVARHTIAFERYKEEVLGRPSDVSTSEVVGRGENDKLLQECAAYAACNAKLFRAIAKSTIIGFCFYQFAKRKPLEAKTFFDKLKSGTDLSETNAIRIVREYMIARPKLTTFDKVELIFRAWNNWINDRETKLIRLQAKLPKIEG
jgi:hypothetical protein